MAELRALLFLAVMTVASTASAAPILSTIPREGVQASSGGFWIGAFEIDPGNLHTGPDGYDRFTVAQTFVAYRDYTGVTASVALSATGLTDALGAPVSVSFRLTTDGGGNPGETVATTDVAVTSTSRALYELDFGALALNDGQTYWLVASSPNVQFGFGSPRCCAGAVPIWAATPHWVWGGAMGYQQNDAPWVLTPYSFMFTLDGTLAGDSVANGDGPPPRPPFAVPEPSTWLLLGLSLPFVAARVRRGSGRT